MGLLANIYKHGGASYANGGLSGEHDDVCIVNVPGPFEPSETHPAVALVPGNVAGAVKVIPVVDVGPVGPAQGKLGRHEVAVNGRLWRLAAPRGCAGPMMGGCYVGTSDSRLGETIAEMGGSRWGGPVSLHDRFEGAALAASMD